MVSVENNEELKMLEKNMGKIDRAVRLVAGVALIAAATTGSAGAWAYLGIIPVFTAIIGSCPAYTLLRIRTCKVC